MENPHTKAKSALHWENKKARETLIDHGALSLLMGELVREYLEFYSLDYTREIFVPESGLSGKDTRPRERLALDSRIGEAPQDRPLLIALLEKFMSGGQA